jgi:hypothetical protein
VTRVCLALLYYNPQLQRFSLPHKLQGLSSIQRLRKATHLIQDSHQAFAGLSATSLRLKLLSSLGKYFKESGLHLLAKDSGDWADDFHLVTLEDLESDSPPSIPFPEHLHTIGAHTKTSAKPQPSLPPLLIPDSKTTPLSIHTPSSKTAITGTSPTPTLAEVAHITSSFPHPPSHLPIAIASTSTSAFTPHNSH